MGVPSAIEKPWCSRYGESIVLELADRFGRVALQCWGEGETGLLVLFRSTANPDVSRFVNVGIRTPQSWMRCVELVYEKSDRLLLHPDHYSSALSEDADSKLYPGAVRSCSTDNSYIVTVSGLSPGRKDEALALEILYWIGGASEQYLRDVADATNNPFVAELPLLHAGQPLTEVSS